MKSAVLSIALVSASIFGLSHKALAICTDGSLQPGTGAIDPYAPISDVPYYPTSPVTPMLLPTAPSTGVQPGASSPSAPSARITVVDASSSGRAAKPAVPTARLTALSESAKDASKANAAAVAKTLDALQSEADKIAADAAPAKEEIDPALKGLVGTWLAVARHGDGELTTVELKLDDRGWAQLTVPGADGKPSTMKRRVELEDEELKLTGPDAEVTLGKLIDVTSRQMVLARADGQITFVRP